MLDEVLFTQDLDSRVSVQKKNTDAHEKLYLTEAR